MAKKKITRKDRINARNKQIRDTFKRDTGDKHLDSNYVISELAKQHTLSTGTIELIISQKKGYKH